MPQNARLRCFPALDRPRCPIARLAAVFLALLTLALAPGCSVMRQIEPNRDLQHCADGFARTDDGWLLGVKHYVPDRPDPSKLPVVLCHGLGLNGTFWTLTDDHLPGQLMDAGYRVFVVDVRGSGGSHREGTVGYANRVLRQTPLLEIGEHDWTMDDEAFHDVPAILDYVTAHTGAPQVHWVGHSLGGMIMFPFLELGHRPERVATFVAMGSPVHFTAAPHTKLINANKNLCRLLTAMSTSRMSRFLRFGRPPGLEAVDRFYYLAENVDRRTIDRFYGYTLEDPGRAALEQLRAYLETGRLVSADGKVDYTTMLDRVRLPILFVAGDGDVLAPLDSVITTHKAVPGPDNTLYRFGKSNGSAGDYGHCDLVWSRHAPREVFPAVIDWLDKRQGLPTPQTLFVPAEPQSISGARPEPGP